MGSTEMPSGSPWPAGMPLSMMILTGTRRTILTKLPVAFSAGKAEELRAAALLDAVDMAVKVQMRIGVDGHFDFVAGAHAVELGFLEIGHHPEFR